MSRGRGTLGGSFQFAGRGVLDAALRQRNMRVHLVAAVLVATFGSAVPLGVAEQLALLLAVFLVLSAEVMNSALEAAVDLAGGDPDERARVAKDAAAGAVLVVAVGAAAVFAVVLVRDWELVRSARVAVARVFAVGLPLAALSAFLVVPFRRPEGLDLLAAAAGAALLLPMALFSASLVFTGVAALAFGLCAAAAMARRGE
ncbi:MAG TPA: diacylglycerol kinase family protein [Anaeromyxobacteraceae bacterium]|jgi:diacylglycerol kinase